MNRTTIDFGIDLGTTNSAIAVLRGTVPDIIKNNMDNDITPSSVFINKDGEVQVGQRAKNHQENQKDADDVHIEFKRRMGTDYKYIFKNADRTMLPEELSAEVLKSLRGDVQQRLGEDVQTAVITVPAAFEVKQCAATKRAGELAGFSQCPLIMEPTAAAFAYGFQSDITKEYWLVYDFGGGTFDACLMKAEDGAITIVNHGGDNYLGGSDIDWAIIDKIIIPKLMGDHNLPGFSRGNKKWRTALAVIKRATEIAKIQLSRSDTAYLEDCKIKDADGEEIDVDLKLTRDAVIGVAEPIIMKSVEICKRVLKEKNLSPTAIGRIILVGGPTLSPYFREILHSNLGIQLDHSVDPLTVVAKGAAVFAGTQRMAAPKAAVGQFSVKLAYKNMGPEPDPTVRGEVSSAEDISVEGFTIECVNCTPEAELIKGWRSGKIPLKAGGKFRLQLNAEKNVRNTYAIELLDGSGRKQAIVPDVLVYTMTGTAGMISEQPIIHSIALSLANNEADVFFKKGDPLPGKATRVYHSSGQIKKGESSRFLKIPVVEGESEYADRNRLLGELAVDGTTFKRDVPAGAEIEVRLHIDKDRIIRVKAFVNILDEEFEAVIDINKANPKPQALQQDFDTVIDREKSLRKKAAGADDPKANEFLDELDDVEELKSLIEAAKGNPDDANKAEKRLLERKMKLDQAEDALMWPSLKKEAVQALEELDNLIKNTKEIADEHREKTEEFRNQIESLIAENNNRPEKLRKTIEQLHVLYFDIQRERPEFWVGLFRYAEEQSDKITDQNAAERLLNQGRQAIQKGNVNLLRAAAGQLFQLLPRDVAAEAQRRGHIIGGDVGLLK